MHFHTTSHLTDSEKAALLEWGDDIFESEPLQLFWRPKDTHLVAYVDETPVSKCGLLKQVIQVGDSQLTIGGVGGVVTVPAQQKRGYARAVLQEALDRLQNQWQCDAALLFCRQPLVGFYQQLGWQLISEPVTIAQPQGKMPAPVPALYKLLLASHWPQGPVTLNSMPW